MNIQAIKRNVRAGYRVAVHWKYDGEIHYLLRVSDDGNFLIADSDWSDINWINASRLEESYHNPQIVPYEPLEVEVGDEVVVGDYSGKVTNVSYTSIEIMLEDGHIKNRHLRDLHLNMEDKIDLSDEQLLEEIRKRGLVKDGEVIK